MGMNVFRLAGDGLHLSALVMLPYKLHSTGSATGVSLKTQELYFLVFLTRYSDLLTTFFSTYNTTMKITFIGLTAIAIVMLRRQPSLKASYDSSMDSFRHWRFAVLPCVMITVLLGTLGQGRHTVLNECWTFSEVLESVVVVPQLLLLRKHNHTDLRRVQWVFRYVTLLAAYRGLYILNWVYRAYYTFGYRHHLVLYITAIVQLSLNAAFFIEHVTRDVRRPLPVLSDEVEDIMDSKSFAREHLLQRGRVNRWGRSFSDGEDAGVGFSLRESSPADGFGGTRDSAPALAPEEDATATGSLRDVFIV